MCLQCQTNPVSSEGYVIQGKHWNMSVDFKYRFGVKTVMPRKGTLVYLSVSQQVFHCLDVDISVTADNVTVKAYELLTNPIAVTKINTTS